MTDALNLALARELDRFNVPPISKGRADRIVVAATNTAALPEPRRRFDRRGAWRRGRQVVVGGLAIGLLSAAAVASGLLGSVGIEVPVLTAMLAPKPKPVVKPHHVARPVERQALARPAPPIIVSPVAEPAPAGLLPRPLLPAERMALREDRRERRQAFAAEHPVIAARIAQRVRETLRDRALARRAAITGPALDSSSPDARVRGPAERIGLARAARRDRLVAEKMIDRRIRQREARLETQVPPTDTITGPPVATPPETTVRQRPFAGAATPEQRTERRARIQAMPPAERATFRERMQERRAMRLERQRQRPGTAN